MLDASKVLRRAQNRVNYQFKKIERRGVRASFRLIPVALNHCIRFLLSAVATIVALLPALVIRIARPFILIRFGYFDARRMGHFSVDLGTCLAQQSLFVPKRKTFDLYFFKGVPANYQLAKMATKEFFVASFVKYLWAANRSLPFRGSHTLMPAIVSSKSRDTNGVLYKSKSRFSFSEEENLAGREFLNTIGLDNCSHFICLNTRDGAYLKEYLGESNWDYHSYRNVDINNYRLAATYLAEKGYGVVRMGKAVENSFNVNNSRVFDYASSEYRCDFLDVWLMANCLFCISNGTGLDSVSDIFRVPTVMVDFIPLTHLHTWQDAITLPKHLYWDRENIKELVLSEVIKYGFVRTEDYVQSGITIVDSSPVEILSVVTEMEQRLTTGINDTDLDSERQSRFWELFQKSEHFAKYHGFIHPRNRLSQHMLRENVAWLN